MMEVIHELLGYNRIKIIQNDEMFSFSLDSILLANFVETTLKTNKIIDLGCGNAPIPLYLTLKTNAKIIGVEIQKEIADMAKRGVELNGLGEQIEIINDDLKGIYLKVQANTFDIVVSNPPYFKVHKESNLNKNDYLTIARHEVMATLDDIVVEAKKLLVDGGSLYLVHRAERIEDIFVTMSKHNMVVKKLQFVYSKKSSSNALAVLIQAKKNKNSGLKVLQPIYAYDDNGKYTEEIKKIFNFK